MRARLLLPCLLLSIILGAYATAQTLGENREDVAETKEAPESPSPIVQLELWVVTLSPDATTESVEQATLPVTDSKAVRARISELEKAGSLNRSRYMLLSTLSGEEAMLQFGSREPRVTATTFTGRGNSSAIQFESIGTLVRLHPHLMDQAQLTVNLQFEESTMESSDVVMSDENSDEPIKAQRIRQFVHTTSLTFPDGGAVVVMAGGADGATGSRMTVMYLAAKVVK